MTVSELKVSFIRRKSNDDGSDRVETPRETSAVVVDTLERE